MSDLRIEMKSEILYLLYCHFSLALQVAPLLYIETHLKDINHENMYIWMDVHVLTEVV